MEYAKDEVFRIQYHEGKTDWKKRKEESRVLQFLKKHTLIKVITSLTVLLSIINFVLIYHFFTLLSNI